MKIDINLRVEVHFINSMKVEVETVKRDISKEDEAQLEETLSRAQRLTRRLTKLDRQTI